VAGSRPSTPSSTPACSPSSGSPPCPPCGERRKLHGRVM
jgi:hypothetical protein